SDESSDSDSDSEKNDKDDELAAAGIDMDDPMREYLLKKRKKQLKKANKKKKSSESKAERKARKEAKKLAKKEKLSGSNNNGVETGVAKDDEKESSNPSASAEATQSETVTAATPDLASKAPLQTIRSHKGVGHPYPAEIRAGDESLDRDHVHHTVHHQAGEVPVLAVVTHDHDHGLALSARTEIDDVSMTRETVATRDVDHDHPLQEIGTVAIADVDQDHHLQEIETVVEIIHTTATVILPHLHLVTAAVRHPILHAIAIEAQAH
ncbi:hypothetical protein BGZ94_000141, partial [Podila epigama]